MLGPNFLQIRDRVELRVSHGDSVSVFDVRVQDIQPDGIYIDRPIIDKRLMPARIGSLIEIQFQRQDATYRFNTRILREEAIGLLPILVVERPRELERIQRREHFRLDIEMPVRLHRLQRDKVERLSPAITGTAVDLSAGGLKLAASEDVLKGLEEGERVLLSFSLEKLLSIFRVEAVVLKILPDSRRDDYLVLMCRFTDIPKELQEEIIVHNIRYQQRYRVEKGGRAG
ncbi:MAG: hypothetical protein FJY67_11975 [Calditrichaeota bacterium]|nr:hypothetical protein [Calditrichota bacterium]